MIVFLILFGKFSMYSHATLLISPSASTDERRARGDGEQGDLLLIRMTMQDTGKSIAVNNINIVVNFYCS
jgi:hypothetical protein